MTSSTHKMLYRSPIGPLEIVATTAGLKSLKFRGKSRASNKPRHACLQATVKQLDEYFKGERSQFKLKLDMTGTAFQNRVWKSLQRLNYGKVKSYSEIARSLGSKRQTRAVARAVATNPVSIVVPCHRVIAKDGSLSGYAWGKWRKAWLLKHEKGRA